MLGMRVIGLSAKTMATVQMICMLWLSLANFISKDYYFIKKKVVKEHFNYAFSIKTCNLLYMLNFKKKSS